MVSGSSCRGAAVAISAARGSRARGVIVGVLIYLTNGWPKSEPAWAQWYREFQLRPGDPRGTRDRKAVKGLANAMRESQRLANTDVLKTLDRATLGRYGVNEPPV